MTAVSLIKQLQFDVHEPRRAGSLLMISALLLACLTACSSSDDDRGKRSDQTRPNILLIVADDLGYSDIGAFGSEIHTPNLDTLAAEGRLLLDHHSAFSCAPTRAILHAGTDQHVTGIGNQRIKDYQVGKPGYEGYLNQRSLYLAELLKDGGYHTYIAGKWHLGEAEDQGPPARGYERSWVLLPGAANHFGSRPDQPLPDNTGPFSEDGKSVTPPADYYSTDFFTDKLIYSTSRAIALRSTTSPRRTQRSATSCCATGSSMWSASVSFCRHPRPRRRRDTQYTSGTSISAGTACRE